MGKGTIHGLDSVKLLWQRRNTILRRMCFVGGKGFCRVSAIQRSRKGTTVRDEQPPQPMGVLLFREHLELLNKLPCEKRCEVLDALFAYSYDHVIPELDSLSELVFVAIRQSLDRNAEKYRIRCEKNREAALKRWHKEKKAEEAYVNIQTRKSVMTRSKRW